MTIREKSQFVQSKIRNFLNEQLSDDDHMKEHIIDYVIDTIAINFHEPRSK